MVIKCFFYLHKFVLAKAFTSSRFFKFKQLARRGGCSPPSGGAAPLTKAFENLARLERELLPGSCSKVRRSTSRSSALPSASPEAFIISSTLHSCLWCSIDSSAWISRAIYPSHTARGSSCMGMEIPSFRNWQATRSMSFLDIPSGTRLSLLEIRSDSS